jgi:hypothetical protein
MVRLLIWWEDEDKAGIGRRFFLVSVVRLVNTYTLFSDGYRAEKILKYGKRSPGWLISSSRGNFSHYEVECHVSFAKLPLSSTW